MVMSELILVALAAYLVITAVWTQLLNNLQRLKRFGERRCKGTG